MYLTAGGCYLINGEPGHGHYWQFLGEEQYVSLPRPKSSYPLQREVPSQAMSEDIVEVIDVDEDIVELRLGDCRPRWIVALMSRGGQ